MKITLPWPPSKTSKNGSQADYCGKARAAKAYKIDCAWHCTVQRIKPINVLDGDIPVKITYHPPNNRRVDWDNLAGRAKQGWDAIAEATGVDDCKWWPVTCAKGAPVKNGKIVVELLKS